MKKYIKPIFDCTIVCVSALMDGTVNGGGKQNDPGVTAPARKLYV